MTAAATGRWRVALAVLVAVHLAVLYAPDTGGAPTFPAADKVVHVATFASVALAGLRAGLGARWWPALVAGHAVVSELVQHWLLPGRSGDPADVVADLLGAALGVLAVALLGRASWSRDRSGPLGKPHRTPAGRDPGPG